VRTDLRDILKTATGVFLGLVAFWFASAVLAALTPQSAQERAAQDLLERQFAPAH
jgi:hypothetical protein